MNIYERFSPNKQKAEEGVWYDVDLGEVISDEALDEWLADDEASGLRIAQLGQTNKTLMKAAARARSGRSPERENAKMIARAIVRDWRGPAWVNPDGERIEYSPEACFKVLDALPELLAVVLRVAQDLGNFRNEKLADAEKNS